MLDHSTKKHPQNTPKTRGSSFPNLAQFTKRPGSGCQGIIVASASFACLAFPNRKKFTFAGPRDFEGGNTRRAFVDSMLKAEQVRFCIQHAQ